MDNIDLSSVSLQDLENGNISSGNEQQPQTQSNVEEVKDLPVVNITDSEIENIIDSPEETIASSIDETMFLDS